MREREQLKALLAESQRIDNKLKDSIESYARLVWKIKKTLDEVERKYGRAEDNHAC